MKVLHVMASAAPERGGPSSAVAEMTRALAVRGHSVTVTSHDDRGGLSRPRFDDRVEYLRFPLTDPTRWQYSRPYHRWLRQHVVDYDAVHIHAIFLASSLLAAQAALSHGITTVIRPAGSLNEEDLTRSSYQAKRLYLRAFEGRLLQKAAAIHCTSQQELAALRRAGFRNGIVVPHGVPAELFQVERRPVRGLYLYLGRVTPKKGLDLIIRAMASPPLRGIRLVIAGLAEGAYAEHCRELADQLGTSERLHWAGHVGPALKEQLLAQASALLLPSEDENFGIAVVEAMAAGVPVLISPGMSFAPRVKVSGAGRVVPREVGALRDAIEAWQELDDEQARSVGEAARMAAREFSWERTALALEGLYDGTDGAGFGALPPLA